MRTKTLLLAAAAFAAGLFNSQAQTPVYSQNIVGYANIPFPSATYTLMANPLNYDNTNIATTILPSFMISSPGNDNQYDDFQVITFVGGHYVGYTYDQDAGWEDFSGSFSVTPPVLAPGQGFFINNPGASTNITFTGTVTPGPGGTNTLLLPSASYALIASPLPEAGALNNNTNLNFPLQDLGQTYILTFVGGHYTGYTYDTSVNPTTGWCDFSDSVAVPTPTFSVGQAFFYLNAGNPTNWVQTLNSN